MEERWRKRVAVTESEAYAEVQAEVDGRGFAAVVRQRATWEVAAVGVVECWSKTESDSAQSVWQ